MLLRFIVLVISLHRSLDLPILDAMTHAEAALRAEEPELPAELLLSMAYRESRFDALAGPYKLWPEAPTTPPKLSHYICGVLQTTMPTWDACVLVRDPFIGYAEGVAQLKPWLAYCAQIGRHGRAQTVCALAGYARGGEAARRGDPIWSTSLFARAKLLENV